MKTYNIEIREFNGIDYDVLYPITTVENVNGLAESLSQIGGNIDTIHTDINNLDQKKQDKADLGSLAFKTKATLTNGTDISGILPIANGGTGNDSGNAPSASKLQSAKTIQTNLGSTSATSFDGTQSIQIGVTGVLDTRNGGTGAIDAPTALTNLGAAPIVHYHSMLKDNSENKITTIANDTTTNWAKLGNCICWYSTNGQIINQPSQWGFLINLCYGSSDICQIWFTQVSGKIYRRSGNINGWYNSSKWNELFQEDVSLIPIANGGTGLSNSPSLLTNLASTSADNVLKASPRPGVTGILGLANGGLGVNASTNKADARANLGITSIAVRPDYLYGTSKPSSLAEGQLYFVYES